LLSLQWLYFYILQDKVQYFIQTLKKEPP